MKVFFVSILVLLPLDTGLHAGGSQKKELSAALNRLRAELNKVKMVADELNIDHSLINGFFETASSLTDEKAINLLLKEAGKKYRGNLLRYRFYVISSLGFHKNDKTYELFDKILLKDKEELLHIAVSNALSINTTGKDIDPLFKICEDNNYAWEARIQAASAIGTYLQKAKEQKMLLRFIELLRDQTIRRRIKFTIVAYLQAITGSQLTTLDPVTWTNIVNHSGDTKGRTGTVSPQFFDLKITSDRLIFILSILNKVVS